MTKLYQEWATVQEFLNKKGQHRYRIINKFTGELIDDAQGYGFTSESKALSFIFRKEVKPVSDSEPLF